MCKIPVLPGGIGLYCKSSQAKTPISPKGNRHATLKFLPMQRPSKEKKLNSIQASLVGELERLIFGNIPKNVLVVGASETAAASEDRAGSAVSVSGLASSLS